jgi:uncharacterized protein (DUF302 family)
MDIEHLRAGPRYRSRRSFDHFWPASVRDVGDAKKSHPGGTVEDMSVQGYSVKVPEGYDEAVVRTRLALRGEGFSILTEMHVGGLLGTEAGAGRQYLIMGSWNAADVSTIPGSPDIRVASQLPCNVVVHESGTEALVSALDPTEGLEGADHESLTIAGAARDALQRALVKVSSPLP